MALITRRRLIGSSLAAAGVVAAPAISSAADDSMVPRKFALTPAGWPFATMPSPEPKDDF